MSQICQHGIDKENGVCSRCEFESDNAPTLRDQFAMAALPAIITVGQMLTIEQDCDAAYQYADAMMKARWK